MIKNSLFLLLVAFSNNGIADATIQLSNYEPDRPIICGGNIAKGNVFCELLGNGKLVAKFTATNGYFDCGVIVVPGIADNASVNFVLRAWTDGSAYPGTSPGAFGQVSWSQATGSWSSNSVPPVPATGPALNMPSSLLMSGACQYTTLTFPSKISPFDIWTLRPSGSYNNLNKVTYGNNVFVAVGDSGTILTSQDGQTWTKRSSGVTNTLSDIAYAADKFVAVGKSETICYSSDGTNWTRCTVSIPFPTLNDQFPGDNHLTAVTYGNSKFVVLGSWVARTRPAYLGILLSSADGIHWNNHSQGSSEPPNSIAYGDGKFVAIGAYEKIQTSIDGITWVRAFQDWDYTMGDITYGNNRFVIVGSFFCYISLDGTSWVKFYRQEAYYDKWLWGIAFGKNGTFVAVGGSGFICSSSDGISWTNHNSVTKQTLNSIVYGSDTYVAVGAAGTIIQSERFSRPPRILNGKFNRDHFEMVFEGTVGQTYHIQSLNDLSRNNEWKTLSAITLTNYMSTWSDVSNNIQTKCFYRTMPKPE